MLKFKHYFNKSNIIKRNGHLVDQKKGTIVCIDHNSKHPVFESFEERPKFDQHGEYSRANDHIDQGGPENVSRALNNHYGVSDNHPAAKDLHNYTVKSRNLNNELVRRHVSGESEKPPRLFGIGMSDTDKKIQRLDQALNKGRAPDNMVVYSGTKFHPGIKAQQHPENKLFMPGYTSTTTDPDTALRFAARFKENSEKDYGWNPKTEEGIPHKHVIAFHVPKGYRGLHISDVSQNEGELEHLLPRKTSWKLDENPEEREYNDYNSKGRVSVWHARPA